MAERLAYLRFRESDLWYVAEPYGIVGFYGQSQQSERGANALAGRRELPAKRE